MVMVLNRISNLKVECKIRFVSFNIVACAEDFFLLFHSDDALQMLIKFLYFLAI